MKNYELEADSLGHYDLEFTSISQLITESHFSLSSKLYVAKRSLFSDKYHSFSRPVHDARS